MAHYQWRPGYDVYHVQREMNRLFEEFSKSENSTEENVEVKWSPKVDIAEHSDDILLVAELAGVSKDDISISVDKSVLTLSGTKVVPEDAEHCFQCSERSFGPFERKFTLPTMVDDAKIKADFKDGVLSIVLPKAEMAKPREIAISAS